MKKTRKTHFDRYLEAKLRKPGYAALAAQADRDWDVALQLSGLRERAGLSQTALARKLKTSQQQISRLESADYQGHSLRMLRKVAAALGASVELRFKPLRRGHA